MNWTAMTEWQRNLVVAEHLMGWRWVEGSHPDVTGYGLFQRWLLPDDWDISDVRDGEWTTYSEDDDFRRLTLSNVPHYTTDLTAAWTALSSLAAEGRHVGVSSADGGGVWYAWVTTGDHTPGPAVLCATPAEAVCVVALRARGHHVDTTPEEQL